MTTETYVVVAHDDGERLRFLIQDLKAVIPESRVKSRRAKRYTIECPIYEEVVLLDYFDREHCTISRSRTYQLARPAAQDGAQ